MKSNELVEDKRMVREARRNNSQFVFLSVQKYRESKINPNPSQVYIPPAD
jgi:hypothetical protein